MALGLRALGVQREQVDRELAHRGLRARFRAVPVRAAHLRELDGPVLPCADILRDHVELRRWDVERIRAGVGDLDIVLDRAVDRHLHDAAEAADAVHVVHDEVADGEVRVGLDAFAV